MAIKTCSLEAKLVTSIALATMTSFGVNDLFVVNGLG